MHGELAEQRFDLAQSPLRHIWRRNLMSAFKVLQKLAEAS